MFESLNLFISTTTTFCEKTELYHLTVVVIVNLFSLLK